MALADTVVLNSASVREFAVSQEGARPDQIRVIHNGVPLEDRPVSFDPSSLRAELRLPSQVTLIGSVGRLDNQKGFDVLLEALALSGREDIHLLLVGSGREEASLRRQAARLNLYDRVHFAGYRRDVPKLLQLLQVYVQPSRFEGMPNALLEAMAAGTPVVATEVDGNRELIEDGVHGWLVPPGNPRALARAVEAALKDPPEARRRAAAAKERVAEKFRVESMIKAWEEILRGGAQENG
jgi:glycosyltransferase involved in cell wall biosynthesis